MPDPLSCGNWVGTAGFEPAIPCSQSRCADQAAPRPVLTSSDLRRCSTPARRSASTALTAHLLRPPRLPVGAAGEAMAAPSVDDLARSFERYPGRATSRPAPSRPTWRPWAASARTWRRRPGARSTRPAGWRLRRTWRSGIFPHRSSRPGDGSPARRQEDAMSVFQPDAESGSRQLTARDLPAFQVVRRGYDPTQVDAYIPQLVARLEEAERARVELQREVASLQRQAPPTFEQLGAEAATVLQDAGRSGEQLVEKARRRADTIVEGAQQQAEQIRTDVTSKAQAVMAEATGAAEQVRQDVEQERAALYAETQEVREFRDGLLEDLGRVHGDISALLERTRKQQEPAVSGGAARPEADAAPDLVVEEAAARRPGHLSAPAGQESRRPGPAG